MIRNRSLPSFTLLLSLLSTGASAQSFWLQKPVYTNTSTSQYQLLASDTSSYVFAQSGFYPATTNDYGASWRYRFLDTPSYHFFRTYTIAGVVHPTHDQIILGANDHLVGHIIRSMDGGMTWKDTTIGSYEKKEFGNYITAMAALDCNHILILVCDSVNYFSNRAMLSSDGGVSWHTVSTPVFQYYPPSFGLPPNPIVSYTAANTLVVAAINNHFTYTSTIYRTTNLGVTWDTVYNANSTLSKSAFINSHLGFASGTLYDLNAKTETATIDKSTDGGASWTNILTKQIVPLSTSIFSSSAGLSSIAFADSIHGLACGSQGLILRTADGGKTWSEMPSDFTIDAQSIDMLGDVAYPDTNHAIISSSNGSALVFHPNGILSLPHITYPLFSPLTAPRTFDIRWDSVPGATRYSLRITGSVVHANDTLIVWDTNITSTFFHVTNLLDTSPSQKAVPYQICLQAHNVTNESNTAQRVFFVTHGTSQVSVNSSKHLSLQLYPNPATSILSVDGAQASLRITDALGRVCDLPQTSCTLNVSALPIGVYYVSDGYTRAHFIKE